MSSSGPPALQQQIHRLNRSSPGFHDQLSEVLYGEEYRHCVPDLRGDDLVWLIDYLDKAFDGLDPSSATSRKCLRELGSICGARGILPTSYTLSSQLLNVGPDPFASGGYGDVYKGTLDGEKVCVKRVRVYLKDDSQRATKTFCQEAVMWKRLTHPNIVPLLGVTITPCQLISNWMAGGDLQEYLAKNPDVNLLGLLSDIARGLCYLHSCNVIHGDLKGPNIVVDDSGNARIVDFGLATVTQNPDSLESASCRHGHTPRWTAPEVLCGGTHSKQADIFAFAMVMIEVFTGAIPFRDILSPMAMFAIMQDKRPPRPIHPTFTEDLWELMQRCWDREPNLRPEISEALRILLTLKHPAWKQLTSHTHTTDERVSLITTIFLDQNQVEMVERLSGDDVQTFIDRIDEVLDSLVPDIRRRCLRYLYTICDRRALLPRSLEIPLCYDTMGYPLCHGGSADIWKGQRHDREVAAKVLRVYSQNGLGQIKRRFCGEVVAWRALRHPNVLPLLGVTVAENRLVMVSEWMVRGNIDEFVKADINADRLGLLSDVTRGLIYMHDQGVVHGNLNGANILIDSGGHARLAGFGLLTIISDRSVITPSAMTGGMIRWMSPERFDPDRFGLKGSHPTKESDCYALGMVMYEVLSGQTPYAQCNQLVVVQKILDGKRPEKPRGPQGAWFTANLWEVLERCWQPQPGDRPSLGAVLQCLQGVTRPSILPDVGGVVETDVDDRSDAAVGDAGPPIPRDNDGFPAPLQTRSPKGGWFGGGLVRSIWRMFKVIA